MRIYNACLKCAPRVSLKIQDAKIAIYLGIITQLCPTVSSHRRHILTIEKNLLNSNISSSHPVIWRTSAH